jgi:hypothetical protein
VIYAQHAFPAIEESALRSMGFFNVQLNEQISGILSLRKARPGNSTFETSRGGLLYYLVQVFFSNRRNISEVFTCIGSVHNMIVSPRIPFSIKLLYNMQQTGRRTCLDTLSNPYSSRTFHNISEKHGALSRPRRILKSQLSIWESLGNWLPNHGWQ